jgi:ketosteroid isomerase-like protein
VSDADAASLVEGYYAALDDGDYDALAECLRPGFSQVRGDVTIEGREAFVQFMRDERPRTDTRHEVDAVYVDRPGGATEVAVRGRLYRADGSLAFGFVDVFGLAEGRLDRLVTYTNARVE